MSHLLHHTSPTRWAYCPTTALSAATYDIASEFDDGIASCFGAVVDAGADEFKNYAAGKEQHAKVYSSILDARPIHCAYAHRDAFFYIPMDSRFLFIDG